MIDLSDYKCPQQLARSTWSIGTPAILASTCRSDRSLRRASSARSIVGVAGERIAAMLQLGCRPCDRGMGNLLHVRLETPYCAQLVESKWQCGGERGNPAR